MNITINTIFVHQLFFFYFLKAWRHSYLTMCGYRLQLSTILWVCLHWQWPWSPPRVESPLTRQRRSDLSESSSSSCSPIPWRCSPRTRTWWSWTFQQTSWSRSPRDPPAGTEGPRYQAGILGSSHPDNQCISNLERDQNDNLNVKRQKLNQFIMLKNLWSILKLLAN